VEAREIEWSATGGVLALLAATPGAAVPGPAYVFRLEGTRGSIDRLSGGGGPIDVGSPLLVESLKKSLIEVVYRRESCALTPDGQSVIAGDAGWDFAVFGLDGTRRSTLVDVECVGCARLDCPRRGGYCDGTETPLPGGNGRRDRPGRV